MGSGGTACGCEAAGTALEVEWHLDWDGSHAPEPLRAHLCSLGYLTHARSVALRVREAGKVLLALEAWPPLSWPPPSIGGSAWHQADWPPLRSWLYNHLHITGNLSCGRNSYVGRQRTGPRRRAPAAQPAELGSKGRGQQKGAGAGKQTDKGLVGGSQGSFRGPERRRRMRDSQMKVKREHRQGDT